VQYNDDVAFGMIDDFIRVNVAASRTMKILAPS